MRLLLLALAVAAHAGTLRYWIEPCPAKSPACHTGDPELAQWAMEAWQAASAGGITLERVDTREHAQIRVNWSGGREGLYGEARPIVVEGLRGAEVYVVTPANPIDDALVRDTIVYLTCLHETGHALGLEHTAAFADIMYNFQYGGDIAEYFGRYRRKLATRADIRKNPGMSEDDRKRIAALTSSPR